MKGCRQGTGEALSRLIFLFHGLMSFQSKTVTFGRRTWDHEEEKETAYASRPRGRMLSPLVGGHEDREDGGFLGRFIRPASWPQETTVLHHW